MIGSQDFFLPLWCILDLWLQCAIRTTLMAVKFLLACFGTAVFDNIKAAAPSTFKGGCHRYHIAILHSSVTTQPLPTKLLFLSLIRDVLLIFL
jgi:hypothetical protein